jgi:non-specific protein-tyrosine kinase
VELELRQLIGYARKWWWMLVLLPLIAGGAAYYVGSQQTPLYSATSTLLVNPGQAGIGDSFNTVQTGQQLATTYKQLVVTQPVLQPVIDRLDLPYTVNTLQGKVSASIVSDTQLIKVSVSDPSPEAAAAIANEVAASFQSFIGTQAQASNSTSRNALDTLIADTQQQIADLRTQIDGVESGEAQLDPGTDLTTLQARLSQLEQSYADLLVQSQKMEVNAAASQGQVYVSVPAMPPSTPYAPRKLFYAALATFLGALVAIGCVALLEYLDNTVKPSINFERDFGMPLMSVLTRVPKLKPGAEQVVILEHPTSSFAEETRLLRTNLEFAAASKPISSLSITSALPGDGKSTVAANLSVAMAQAGFQTILIDADLRRPTLHKVFNIPNSRGLTTLLLNPDQGWEKVATWIPGANIWLLPSGPLPPSPADLLSSDALPTLVEQLGQLADVVIVDTPPVLAVSDPLVIATHVDGVLMVASSGSTRIDVLHRAIDSLPRDSVRMIGVVLNQHAERSSDSQYYGYSSAYYGTESEAKPINTPAMTLSNPVEH